MTANAIILCTFTFLSFSLYPCTLPTGRMTAKPVSGLPAAKGRSHGAKVYHEKSPRDQLSVVSPLRAAKVGCILEENNNLSGLRVPKKESLFISVNLW